MKKTVLLFVVAILSLIGCGRSHGRLVTGEVFPADCPQADYVGRVEKPGDGSVSFDWAGVCMRTVFKGDHCLLRASDTKSSYFHVFVDGRFFRDINIRSNDTIVELYNGTGGGMHTLNVFKRTEGSEGLSTFHAIITEPGGQLFPYHEKPRRRIEFIGNSITCGFGTETNDPHEAYSVETENAYYSYASIVSRMFGGDCTLIAHSGQGVVRNYGDERRLSDYTMRQRFLTLYDTREDPKWDFSRWRPDLVVVNLGTNDFSQEVQPTEREFIDGYKQLTGLVRKVYGDIPLLCLSSPMSNETQRSAVETACAEMNDHNIFFIPLYRYLLDNTGDMGLSYHPNRSGQRKIAWTLAPYISSIMGWEMDITVE